MDRTSTVREHSKRLSRGACKEHQQSVISRIVVGLKCRKIVHLLRVHFGDNSLDSTCAPLSFHVEVRSSYCVKKTTPTVETKVLSLG